jgi:hypothetical protein
MRRELVYTLARRDISRGWKGVDEKRERQAKIAFGQTS